MGNHTYLAASSSGSSFNPTSLILILVVIVGVYMLMIRPQRRRQQQAAKQQNTLLPGARVRTTAGMYATVVDVDGDDVVLEVAPGIEVRYMRRAVMDVVSPGEETPDDSYEDEDEDADDGEPDTAESEEETAHTGSTKND
ncbi:MAG: preprotein translocase subunit YajC [Trebonia sp.]|jgi:preprotein translocase subunit YajC|uniref:preprotein translocase subunit YajC n=2 Tax=Trebonia sp. TaxID=2767075 RepID=UPI003BAF3169